MCLTVNEILQCGELQSNSRLMPGMPRFRSSVHAGLRPRSARAALLALALVLAVLSGAGEARAALPQALKSVVYRGYRLRIPAAWPVYRVSARSSECVRFNRHAVYLGEPGDAQLCPPAAAGRTEAILVEPLGASPPSGIDAGAEARVVDRAAGVVVTATWGARPAVIRRALGVASLAPYARLARATPRPAIGLLRRSVPRRRSASERAAVASPLAPATPGGVFSGAGFDACSAPSLAALAAWSTSPFGAVGVYIGGANAACAQPNLTAAWVSAASAAGWHLLPLYVGLQAPGNSCGCAAIAPAGAAADGTAAAVDAVAQAQSLGIGSGNPIYFDMEAYQRSASASPTVLAFLAAWTAQLHADGYLSGVYSSDDSGVADLVAQVGTGYTEPDELWNANWNGSPTTSDPAVPAGDWVGQRLHQYLGAADQTYGGVTINVDQDEVGAATAAAGTAAGSGSPAGSTGGTAGSAPAVATVAQAPPAATTAPTITGAALLGQTLTEAHAAWSGSPTSYSDQWEACGLAAGACLPIAGATASTYTVVAANVGEQIRVLETAANSGGVGAPTLSAATGAVRSTPASGYWLLSSSGNVAQSPGASWFGSAVRAQVTSFTGMAPTPTRRGYWLVDAAGRVFAYGNARSVAAGRYGHPIIGIAGSFRGAWLYTAAGNVFSIAGAPWYGSALHERQAPIVGMASTRNGRGYWLIDASGRIYAFGNAPQIAAVAAQGPVRGIVPAPGGGVWVFTAAGDIVGAGGATAFGSPLTSGLAGVGVVGITPTPGGAGYWVLDSAGQVLAYGNAPTFAVAARARPIVGISS